MQVKEGTIDVDQSALTGESLPVTLRGGDAAQMGATVVRGETHAIGRAPTAFTLLLHLRIMERPLASQLPAETLLCACSGADWEEHLLRPHGNAAAECGDLG